MVICTEEMKKKIRSLGYERASALLGRSESYLRSLCSKGVKKIRKSHADLLMKTTRHGKIEEV